ncbi:unnamed protein product [Phaeothamnion confervicola]
MSFYAAYHQDTRNKLTHFVGVPAIIVAILAVLAWARADLGGTQVSAAMAVTTLLLAYYLALDALLGLAMIAVFAGLLGAGESIAALPMREAAAWILPLFVGGWIVQLLGHVFEGRKPALADNLFQVFVAPIFLCAEVFFLLGYKPALHAAVQRRALQMRAEAGIGAAQPG